MTVAPKATVAAVWHSEMCVPILTSSRSWCHSLNSPVAVLMVVFILRHLQHIRTELAASPRVPKMPHLPQSVVFVSCCHQLVQLVWITGESMTHNSIWIQGVYASGFWILGQKKNWKGVLSVLECDRKEKWKVGIEGRRKCAVVCVHLKFISVNNVVKNCVVMYTGKWWLTYCLNVQYVLNDVCH